MKDTRTEYEVRKTTKEVEVEDYEKVEVEKEVYVCDSCEQEYDVDGDVTVHEVAINPPDEHTETFQSWRELDDLIDCGYENVTSSALEFGMGIQSPMKRPLRETINMEYQKRAEHEQGFRNDSRMKIEMEQKVGEHAIVTKGGTAYIFGYRFRVPISYRRTKHMCEYCHDAIFES